MSHSKSLHPEDEAPPDVESAAREPDGDLFQQSCLAGRAIPPRSRTWEQTRLLLMNLYYHGTLPYRWWRNTRAAAAGRAPVLVLFYHRIADDQATPWTTSNKIFARQLRWLRKRFELVSLAEAQRRIASGTNHLPTASITFDDGYAANCDAALPLLIRERIPCTYFVSSRFVLDNLPFPHDVARGRPLPPNTLQQLRELSAAGIDIGAHTRTHCDLAQVDDPQRLYAEIVTARDELEDALGVKARYFAFPFGQHVNMTPEAFAIAREAGYDGVCSAYGGYNFPGDDAFHMQRIHGDDDMIQLKNWTTIDPRKLLRVRRFEYQLSSNVRIERGTRS